MEGRFPITIDLDELAGLRDWHPGAEELVAYLEGLSDELDADCIGLHLEECGMCEQRLKDASSINSLLKHISGSSSEAC
jgi:anti-sigma factor ChrR (cupin superfamily)